MYPMNSTDIGGSSSGDDMMMVLLEISVEDGAEISTTALSRRPARGVYFSGGVKRSEILLRRLPLSEAERKPA
jgi:hypothetical protein